MTARFSLLLRRVNQVVTLSSNRPSGSSYKCGVQEMNDLGILENVDIIVGRNGHIVDICSDDQMLERYCSGGNISESFEKVVDAQNCSVIPGFVDPHTHACWAGDRLNEFVMKLNGATYLDIHRMGGGIHYTVRCTREASEEHLERDLIKRLSSMLTCGTTTVEVKSGYGLDTDTEMKMLRVINQAREKLAGKMNVIATFCGAHAVPQGDNPKDSTERVINEMLPLVAQSKNLKVDGGVDIFCERGIFETEHTRRILESALKVGNLHGNFHGDELSCTNSAELAVEMKARAVSHLEEISDDGIAALSESVKRNGEPTVAVLLPSTAYLLRLKMPPARKLIDSGACVALGSDFNPNAYCYNMPLVMNLACVLMRMTPAEALSAATVNAAAALGLADSCGTIEKGRLADFVVIDSPRWENIIYQVGCSNEIIRHVVKSGNVVYTKP